MFRHESVSKCPCSWTTNFSSIIQVWSQVCRAWSLADRLSPALYLAEQACHMGASYLEILGLLVLWSSTILEVVPKPPLL